MWGGCLIWFQFNVLLLIQTVIKYSQSKMPPEHGSLFKAKMVAKLLISSQILIHSSGYNFSNSICEDPCNAENFSTDLEKVKSNLVAVA